MARNRSFPLIVLIIMFSVLTTAYAGPTYARTSPGDIDQYLSAHNTVREQHGAVDLTWDDTLASAAQNWANGCKFQHSGGTLGPYGGRHLFRVVTLWCITHYLPAENLAAGTGNFDIPTAIKLWTDEVCKSAEFETWESNVHTLLAQYDPNNPQPSHFTQVVWKATRQVGCAVQQCDGIFDPSFGVSF